jgi:beta-lactamase class C
MGDRSRAEFLRTAAGAAALATLVRPDALRAATAGSIKRLVDAQAVAARDQGRTAVAIVAGAVAPGIPPQLFLAGSPVAAQDHARPLRLGGQTAFLIGSITKVFTSRVYAMRQGTYAKRLGDTIRVPLPAGVRDLSIVDIAHYSAGFPSDNASPVWWQGVLDGRTLPDLLASIGRNPALPQCAPGANYAYSNLSWGLMGLASLGVTDAGQPVSRQWADAIGALGRELGLRGTTPWSATTAHDLPAGYGSGSAILSEAFDYGARNWATLGGGGDLVSTGDDMLTWLQYNMGRTGKDVALLRGQQTPTHSFTTIQPPTRGAGVCGTRPLARAVTTSIGWFHARPHWNNDVVVLQKNGGVRGFNSWMGFESWAETGSASRTGVFVLSNAPDIADALGNQIIQTLLQ